MKELLTRDACLRALNDVLRVVRLDARGEILTEDVTERISAIETVVKLFVELQGCKDFTEVGHIGFGDWSEEEEEE